jgi:putative cell wall-binding protein
LKNSSLEINFHVPTDIDVEIELFDKHGKLVAQSSYYGLGDAEVLMTTGNESGPYYLALSSADGNPSLKPYQVKVKAKSVPAEGNKERISGPTRDDTSLGFSNKIPDHSLDTILLANGKNYPDALAGVVLNQVLNGTVLLVSDSNSVQQNALNEAKRLLKKDGKVIVLGGVNAISSSVENTFKKHFKVEWISGETEQKLLLK